MSTRSVEPLEFYFETAQNNDSLFRECLRTRIDGARKRTETKRPTFRHKIILSVLENLRRENAECSS